MNFNYKIYFSIIDATCKGLGSPVYEGWLDAVENIQNFTTRSELRISDADVWVLFKDALKEAGLEESDNPLLEVAESVILQMSLNQFVTFYFQTEVAELIAGEGYSPADAKEEVHAWFDEDDNRWFETPDGTHVYFNRDETVTVEPKDADAPENTGIGVVRKSMNTHV